MVHKDDQWSINAEKFLRNFQRQHFASITSASPHLVHRRRGCSRCAPAPWTRPRRPASSSRRWTRQCRRRVPSTRRWTTRVTSRPLWHGLYGRREGGYPLWRWRGSDVKNDANKLLNNSSVDWFPPTILLSRFRIPSTPSTLFILLVKNLCFICHWVEKRTKT